jgi:periplasmic protein TonB
MTMTRLFQGVVLLGVLSLTPCVTYGAERTSEAYEAFAAAAQSQRTPEQGAAIGAWKSQIARQLESKKRYPAAARSRREEGNVLIVFRLDRQGRLVSSRIVRSSGSATLDKAGLALVSHAQPFPPPPPAAFGKPIILPIRYHYSLPRCTLLNRLLGPCTSP